MILKSLPTHGTLVFVFFSLKDALRMERVSAGRQGDYIIWKELETDDALWRFIKFLVIHLIIGWITVFKSNIHVRLNKNSLMQSRAPASSPNDAHHSQSALCQGAGRALPGLFLHFVASHFWTRLQSSARIVWDQGSPLVQAVLAVLQRKSKQTNLKPYLLLLLLFHSIHLHLLVLSLPHESNWLWTFAHCWILRNLQGTI